MYTLELKTDKGVCLTDITEKISALVVENRVRSGLCNLFVPHSTAGVTINSAIDHETPTDIIQELNRLVPTRTDFVHQYDSPQDAAGHIKTSLIGSSVTIPVDNGSLAISPTQSILFCEFDGPRQRRLYVTFIPL